MNPVAYLVNFFRKRATQRLEAEQTSRRWREACDAFQKGKEFHFEKRDQEALSCFDEAIDCGYVDDADVYAMRGGCLQSLNFDLDAIDDFDRAIVLEPENCVAFFQRSLSKGSTGDQHGRVSDLQEAIRLAGIDNAYSRDRDAHARETGYKNCAHYFEMQMFRAKIDLEHQEDLKKRMAANPDIWKPDMMKANMRRRPNIRKTGL